MTVLAVYSALLLALAFPNALDLLGYPVAA